MDDTDRSPRLILDGRVRPPYREFLATVNYDPRLAGSPTRAGTTPPSSVTERSMQHFIGEMDSAGIRKALAMGRRADPMYGLIPNSSMKALHDEYPDRLWCFGGVGESTAEANVAEARYCIEELGLRGIAVDPGWQGRPIKADDGVLYPLYAYCERQGVPVALTMSVLVGPSLDDSNPRAVHEVAQAFPELKILVVHSAWPWVMQVLGVAFRNRNVWLLPDFYLNIPYLPGHEMFVDAVNSFLTDRLIYASSYPSRPLGQSAQEFRSVGFSEEALDACMGSNLLHFLGEEGKTDDTAN